MIKIYLTDNVMLHLMCFLINKILKTTKKVNE